MLSKIEHKLLLALFAVTLLFSCIRTYDIAVFQYNRSVEHAELEERMAASGIRFSGCNACGTPLYETLILFQLVFLFVALACTARRRPGTVVVSILFLLVSAYAYFGWFSETYLRVAWADRAFEDRPGMNSYLLSNSTALDFLVVFCIATLITIQSAILVRFTAESVHARLKSR